MKEIVVNASKISLVISFLALTTSIIAVCVSVKNNNQVVESSQHHKTEQNYIHNDNNKVIINDIPDTTIIKKDGSIVEVKSYKANDNLNGIIMNNGETEKSDVRKNHVEHNIQQEKKDKKILPPEKTKLSQEGVISGKYVIQTGAFKVKHQAQKQCDKIKKSVKLQDMQCQYVFKNNQYRVIIFPFDSKNSADEFAKILSSKRFPVLTKKNI